jgi:hypothetical protein
VLSERSIAVDIGTDAEEWWTSKMLLDAAAVDIHRENDSRAVAKMGHSRLGRYRLDGVVRSLYECIWSRTAYTYDWCAGPGRLSLESRAVTRLHQIPNAENLQLTPRRIIDALAVE